MTAKNTPAKNKPAKNTTAKSTPSHPPKGAGGGKTSPSAPAFYEQADTIRSEGSLRLSMLLCAGPIEGLANGAASIYLDDVPLQGSDGSRTVEALSWALQTGTPDQGAVALSGFNQTESSLIVGLELTANQPRLVSRRQQAQAARITLTFPNGLVHRRRHAIGKASVAFKIEVRTQSGWVETLRDVISEKQTASFEKQYLISLPEGRSTQQLRITRLTPTPAANSGIHDRLRFSHVSWIIWDQLSYADLAVFNMAVSASALDGRQPRLSLDIKGRILKVPDNYTPATRQYAGLWSGQFKSAWSDNPAWVIYDLLTDKRWGLGLKPAEVDRYSLYALARICDHRTKRADGSFGPRYCFNAILDRRQSASQLISDITRSIEASFVWSHGKLRFLHEQTAGQPRLVAPNTVRDGRFVYHSGHASADISHVFVHWDNSAQSDRGTGDQRARLCVFDPDWTRPSGYRARDIHLLGCTDGDQARRHANWALLRARQLQQAVSYRAGLDHFAGTPLRPGDHILLHDPTSSSAPCQSLRLSRTPHLAYLTEHELAENSRIWLTDIQPNAVSGWLVYSDLSGHLRTASMRRFEISSDNDKGPYLVLLNILNPNHLPAENTPALFASSKISASPTHQIIRLAEAEAGQVDVTAVPLLRQLETQLAN
ncbi:MAG: TipJ family phage tail tip protein [Candidatus Puniceispirillaceae bacterium]